MTVQIFSWDRINVKEEHNNCDSRLEASASAEKGDKYYHFLIDLFVDIY